MAGVQSYKLFMWTLLVGLLIGKSVLERNFAVCLKKTPQPN